jgi:hypothetical protein
MFKKLVVFFLIALISTPFAIADKDPKPASSSSNKDGKLQTITIKYKGFDHAIIIDGFEWNNKTTKEQELLRKRYQLEVDICEKMDIRFNGKGIYDFRMLNITPEQLSVRYILLGKEYGLATIRAIFNGSHDSNIRFVKFCEKLNKKQDKVMDLINKCYSNCPEMADNLPIIEEKINNILQNYKPLGKRPIQISLEDETPVQGAKTDNNIDIRKETNLIIPTHLPKDELDIHNLLLKYNKTYKDIIKMLEDGVDNLTIQKNTGINFSYFSNNAAPDLHNIYKFRSRAPLPKEAGKKSSTNPRVYFLYDAKNNKWILLHSDYKKFVGPEKPKEVQSLLNILKDREKDYLRNNNIENVEPQPTPHMDDKFNDGQVPAEHNEYDVQWEKNYELLAKYIKDNKKLPTALTITTDSDGNIVHIGSWVRTQKSSYNGIGRGKIDDYRIKKLEALEGWSWDIRDKTWNDNFELTKNYMAEKKEEPLLETKVTNKNGHIISLGLWLSTQKNKYRKNTLSKDKIEKLESIPGFTWQDKNNASWNKQYDLVLKYISENGTLPLVDHPVTDETGKSYNLGTWLIVQRSTYKNGKLSEERIKKLESIPGWKWHQNITENEPETSGASEVDEVSPVDEAKTLSIEELINEANIIFERIINTDVRFDQMEPQELDILYRYFFENHRGVPDSELIDQLSLLEESELFYHLYNRAFTDAETNSKFDINPTTLSYFSDTDIIMSPEDVNTKDMFDVTSGEENVGPRISMDFNKSNNTPKQPGTTDGEAAVLEPVNTPPKKPTPLAGANQIPVEGKKDDKEIKGNQTELVEIEVAKEQYKDIVVPILGDNNKDPLFDFLNLAKQLNINVSDRVTNKLSTFSNITPESWSQLYTLMLAEYENNNFCALCSTVTSLIYSDAEIPREIWNMTINLLNNNEIDNDVRQTLGKAILSPNNTTIPSELMLNIGAILSDKDLITSWEGQIRKLNKIPTIEELFGTTLNTINNVQEEAPLTKTEVEINDNPLRPEIDRIMIEWNDILKEYKRVSLNTVADLFDKGKISKELLQYLISTKNSNGKENFPLVTTLAIAISKLSSDEVNQTKFIQILEDTYKKDPNKVEDILLETSTINHTPSTPKEKMQGSCIFDPLNEKEINMLFNLVSIKKNSIFTKDKKVSISGLNQKIEASKVIPTEQHLITELQRSLGSQTNDLKNLLDEYILSLAVKVGESEPMNNEDIRLVFGYDNCNYLPIYDYLLENPNNENKDLLIFLGVSAPKIVDPNISAKIGLGFSLTGLFYSLHNHTMKIVIQNDPAQNKIITDMSNRLYERFLIPKNFIETRMTKK